MIAHFDIDAFYASVAVRDDASLRGKPLAVAGNSRRSVVLTASYEARPFGVRSAMPLYEARARCPELVVVAPNFERYRELSLQVFDIFARGGHAVEGLSLDEAYVAVPVADLVAAVTFAQDVRAAVRAEVGLALSAGVATQKMLAKIASDDAKPDGLKAVEPGSEAAYLAPLPVGRLWGVGPKTQDRLRREGIATIGQLATIADADAFRLFGRSGKTVRELARGHDSRGVEAERETQSVSSEETFEYDLRSPDEMRAALCALAHDVAARLERQGLRGSTIGVKVKRGDFTVVGRQTTVAVPTADASAIEAAALLCLERAELSGAAVRLLGVRVASLTQQPTLQTSLFAP